MTTYCCSSGTKVIRGSSIPQISSGIVLRVGHQGRLCDRSAIHRRHSESEQRKDATIRGGLPRGKATASCRPASSVAPALNTLLMEYGQSLPVRIGLAGCAHEVAWLEAMLLSSCSACVSLRDGHEWYLPVWFRLVSRARISRSAIRNDSVDSAPWFSLARSGCKPSRHPPVTES